MTRLARLGRRRRRSCGRSARRAAAGDRGAGLVEYVLVVGLLVIGVAGALDVMERGGERALDDEAAGINGGTESGWTDPDDPSASTTTTAASAPTTTSTTSTTTSAPPAPTSTTTTSAPPAPTTTTSAAPPLPPTTTSTAPGAPVRPEADLAIGSASGTQSWWNGVTGAWTTQVRFDYAGHNGGHVTMEIVRHHGDGSTSTITHTAWVPNGSSTPSIPAHTLSTDPSAHVVAVDLRVTRIQAQDASWAHLDLEVDGPTVRIEAPTPR